MKQPKKPTYDQKREISNHGLDARAWAVVSENKEELRIIEKSSGEIKVLRR